MSTEPTTIPTAPTGAPTVNPAPNAPTPPTGGADLLGSIMDGIETETEETETEETEIRPWGDSGPAIFAEDSGADIARAIETLKGTIPTLYQRTDDAIGFAALGSRDKAPQIKALAGPEHARVPSRVRAAARWALAAATANVEIVPFPVVQDEAGNAYPATPIVKGGEIEGWQDMDRETIGYLPRAVLTPEASHAIAASIGVNLRPYVTTPSAAIKAIQKWALCHAKTGVDDTGATAATGADKRGIAAVMAHRAGDTAALRAILTEGKGIDRGVRALAKVSPEGRAEAAARLARRDARRDAGKPSKAPKTGPATV